jgi:hypothetical protein
MSAKAFNVAQFDSNRLLQGKIDPDYRHVLLDPEYPGFAVKSIIFDNSHTPDPEAEMRRSTAWNYTQLNRLEAACPSLVIPHNFIIYAPPDPKQEIAHAYHYVQRLAGERPDPHNPSHWPFLRSLGAGLLNYLESTAVGDAYSSELTPLQQYTIGAPFFDRRGNTKKLYIHDIEAPIEDCQNRRGVGQDEPEQESPETFYKTCSDVAEWIGCLPESTNTEELKRRSSELRMVAKGSCQS